MKGREPCAAKYREEFSERENKKTYEGGGNARARLAKNKKSRRKRAAREESNGGA